MSPANRDAFFKMYCIFTTGTLLINHLQVEFLIFFIFFSYLLAPLRSSRTMLNGSYSSFDSGHSCLVPDLGGNNSILSTFNTMSVNALFVW